MGTILKGLRRIPWGDFQVPRGSAKDIPTLLAKVAYGDRETGEEALVYLTCLVCELDFVISEATAPTVPFLLDLAATPQVVCRAEVLELLLIIYSSHIWSRSAADAGPKYRHNYARKVQWEKDAHQAVLAGRPVIKKLVGNPDPKVSKTAAKLLRAFPPEYEQPPEEKGHGSTR